MKIMFVPMMGATVSYRGNSNQAVKTAGKELPKRSEGFTNEEIYNAIMSFKNSINRIFPRAKSNTQPANFNKLA